MNASSAIADPLLRPASPLIGRTSVLSFEVQVQGFTASFRFQACGQPETQNLEREA
jgi:hypothetical protein